MLSRSWPSSNTWTFSRLSVIAVGMSLTNKRPGSILTTTLRSTCDRCRSQKLRCKPSLSTDSTAPCQRCSKAKPRAHCVFSNRARPGRRRSSTPDGSDCPYITGLGESDTDLSSSSLPGMGTFVLTSPPTSTYAVVEEQACSPPVPKGGQNFDDSTMGVNCRRQDEGSVHPSGDIFLESLQCHPASSSDVPSIPNFEDNIMARMELDYAFDSNAELDIRGSLATASTNGSDKPAPVVALTTLLAEMHSYNNQLSVLHGIELNDYPIGDALFLAQRFGAILTELHLSSSYSSPTPSPRHHATGQRPHIDMTTMLLMLSCHMTLTRIYSTVFSDLQSHLSHMPPSGSPPQPRPHTLDMQAYRGLRLGELQAWTDSQWVTTTWTKKAVATLLEALDVAEGILELPADVRAGAAITADRDASPASCSSGKTIEDSTATLLDEDLMVSLTQGSMSEIMGDSARELRAKIEAVVNLLFAYSAPSSRALGKSRQPATHQPRLA